MVPFKKGPDFIDPGWLAAAAGHPCFNLDPYLMNAAAISGSFITQTSRADISVIEGNRGLYDGVDVDGTYSTAELAKALAAPVLLVLDTTKMTRTAAALVLGCQRMDPMVRIAGVILNRVAGPRQERLIRSAIEKYCGIPVLGAIPRRPEAELAERHMGLTPADEHGAVHAAIRVTAGLVREYVDLEAVQTIAADVSEVCAPDLPAPARIGPGGVRIGIVRDTAFQFYYPENFSLLEEAGAELVRLNALEDAHVPELDALYIGGGFPETHAVLLAENDKFREAVKQRALEGLPVYAECGGLMFLGREIHLKGKRYPMAGVLPLSFEMHDRPRGHGYTDFVVDGENPFFERGLRLKGHEFHYSSVAEADTETLPTAFGLKRGTGVWSGRDGIVSGSVLACYSHLHALGSPEWVSGMVRAAYRFRGFRRERSDVESIN